jgi:hypothetical protein
MGFLYLIILITQLIIMAGKMVKDIIAKKGRCQIIWNAFLYKGELGYRLKGEVI